jgi:hypothetical protein
LILTGAGDKAAIDKGAFMALVRNGHPIPPIHRSVSSPVNLHVYRLTPIPGLRTDSSNSNSSSNSSSDFAPSPTSASDVSPFANDFGFRPLTASPTLFRTESQTDENKTDAADLNDPNKTSSSSNTRDNKK